MPALRYLAEGFQRKEFACKCGCGFDTVDAELLMVLEEVRSRFGRIAINSGCRCPTHNEKEGGAKASLHLVGQAADIRGLDSSNQEIYDFLETRYPDCYGLAIEGRFVHVDVRSKRARWSY